MLVGTQSPSKAQTELVARLHAFLGPSLWPLLYILSISHPVHVNAADLYVDLLLSELQNS